MTITLSVTRGEVRAWVDPGRDQLAQDVYRVSPRVATIVGCV
jgi:hypothetical protein